MLAQLVKKKKGPKTKGEKEGESSSSEDTESAKHSNLESPKPSSEEEDGSESGSCHSRRMSNLEKYLEVLLNRSNLQDVAVVRHYLAEWDTTHYPQGSRHRPYILSMV